MKWKDRGQDEPKTFGKDAQRLFGEVPTAFEFRGWDFKRYVVGFWALFHQGLGVDVAVFRGSPLVDPW
jgi:hypothetical protein